MGSLLTASVRQWVSDLDRAQRAELSLATIIGELSAMLRKGKPLDSDLRRLIRELRLRSDELVSACVANTPITPKALPKRPKKARRK